MSPQTNKPTYELTPTGEFVITDYNSTKLFSSFFPGIAGKNGIPMWAFYVNRGQCVCSMGVQDKNHPIMEFLPANWAYQLVSTQGFRTFIKPVGHASINFYEPFQNHIQDKAISRTQRMIIAPAHLTLEEVNHSLGLQFTVEYFNVPQDNYAGLVRILHIRNLNAAPVTLEGLDGLPLIIPYGIDNAGLKNMRRLMEAFVEVVNYENRAPFFKGKTEAADRPDVVIIKKGNFYVGFESEASGAKIIEPIVDPKNIFGVHSDYSYPEKFLTTPFEDLARGQIFENRLPSAMGLFKTTIPAGATYTYTSIIGQTNSVGELNALVPLITRKEYVAAKARENREIIDVLTQQNFICSGEPTLDQYTRQNFLDNSLRGGFPYTFQGKENRTTLHLYSRKHGDLERDYNDFRLTPTPYSQGNGNFRDVNQNRRCDLFFNPDVQETNVEHFYNMIQLDGFNPLVTKEIRFAIADPAKMYAILSMYIEPEHIAAVAAFQQKSFTPGELLTFLRAQKITIKGDTDNFLGDLFGICHRIYDIEHGEGYWTDHWTYNLDLLENYLAIYPEKLRYILLEKKSFTFYDEPHRVQPRAEKYVLWEGNPMQLNALTFDGEKDSILKQRNENRHQVRTGYGWGNVYYTSLLSKMLCLIANKLSSLDPAGVGVEMEAGKPNWYDALNGLPGLLGSSISETLETKRHILFLLDIFRETKIENEVWPIFEELKDFIDALREPLNRQISPFEFWEMATTHRENYRARIRLGVSGHEKPITVEEIKDFFTAALKKLDEGIDKARANEHQILSTYFINKVVDYDKVEQWDANGVKSLKCNAKGQPYFRAKNFKQIPLPLFLEGPVHYLRCKPDRKEAAALVENIRQSALFDQKLKMYKVNAPLTDQPLEIGRARVFSPGWFENESIWLHMEYKYMLELLRNGLYEAFYQDFKNVCVPFSDPEVYGRSILENSSFIVSSGNPDPSIHGNGFVARLSGATAEFIQMLLFMSVGQQPFCLSPAGELQLKFTPALAGWLFTREMQKKRLFSENQWQELEFPAHTFSFMFLGSILVTYHNAGQKDTFGTDGVSPAVWTVVDMAGNSQTFKGDSLSGDIVEKIRNRKVRRIDIELR